MADVRIGIIGIGNMGTSHAFSLLEGHIPGGRLTAVCDQRPDRIEWARENLGEDVAAFSSLDEFYAYDNMDAVLIVTQHYEHPPMAIRAFERGLHVLIEKPAGVYTKQVREMNEAAAASGKVFSIMYNQRTNPLYLKLRELIQSGELGDIKRMVWLITNWYRPQSYYDSGGWRATWAGEGGGVLLNQDPHQLDLWQWMTGMMPTRIRAFCDFGKFHNIEVEDDVTIYAQYDNGATGLFVTSTGEAPGTNRFEISADNGKVVIEDGKLTFWRNRVSERKFNAEFTGGFGAPECWKIDVPVQGKESGHRGIIANFVDAILHGKPLIAPGEEGIHGLMISNAAYLSTWTDDWVDMPIDEELYLQELNDRINNSTFQKKVEKDITFNVKGTH